MEKNRYYGLSKHGVVVSGYGKKYTFTRGFGKYKKKFYKVFKPEQFNEISKFIEEQKTNGWGLCSITDVKI